MLVRGSVAGERARAVSVVGGVLGVAALYLWDDLLLAAPIAGATRLWGPWAAFVIFSVVYGLGSFALALLAIRAYERFSAGEQSRLATWLAHQSEKSRSAWGRRFLTSGKAVGFVVASFMLGGILTTWFIRYAGRSHGIVWVAAASSAIFAVTFTAFYAGIAYAIL